jgi:hypothetical protein
MKHFIFAAYMIFVTNNQVLAQKQHDFHLAPTVTWADFLLGGLSGGYYYTFKEHQAFGFQISRIADDTRFLNKYYESSFTYTTFEFNYRYTIPREKWDFQMAVGLSALFEQYDREADFLNPAYSYQDYYFGAQSGLTALYKINRHLGIGPSLDFNIYTVDDYPEFSDVPIYPFFSLGLQLNYRLYK